MATQTIHSASGVVKPRGHTAKLYGLNAISATATAIINIRDGGASGTIRATIASGTAAGTVHNFDEPIFFNDGIYFDLNGATGTIGVRWD